MADPSPRADTLNLFGGSTNAAWLLLSALDFAQYRPRSESQPPRADFWVYQNYCLSCLRPIALAAKISALSPTFLDMAGTLPSLR